jgi:hypothetical protein
MEGYVMVAKTFVSVPITCALLAAALLVPSCYDSGSDDACGEGMCASLERGEWEVAGDPRIDDVFRAAVELDGRLGAIEMRTRQAVERLADAFGVTLDGPASLDENAALVASAIQAAFDDSVEWGDWSAGPAVADVRAAYAAHVACLERFGCGPSLACSAIAEGAYWSTGVLTNMLCEGECRGSCSGSCAGTCATPIANDICTGTCFGACDLTMSPAECDTRCFGICDGPNYLNTGGNNAGPCIGACEGICESVDLGMYCSGSCTGECGVESIGACAGECRGACDAECEGDCVGRPIPGLCSGETCAEADACRQVAGLLGMTGATATWSEYLVVWNYDAEANTVASTDVALKMAVLEDEMRALIDAHAELEALVGAFGSLTASGQISEALQVLVNGDLDAYDVNECRVPCLVDALGDATTILGDAATHTAAVRAAQEHLLAVVGDQV